MAAQHQPQPRVTRFFVTPDQIDRDTGTVTLEAEDALHLDRVLRARPGDEIAALDGSGTLFRATLTTLSKSRADATIIAAEQPNIEPEIHITIAQALPKTAEKLEWVLQHGVEIGAAAFIVFRARRSEAGKLAERPERWAKIVKTAAEQSGRAKLPSVTPLPTLTDLLDDIARYDTILLCDEAEPTRTLRLALAAHSNPKSILALIGPEGGWADEERAQCVARNVTPVTLGTRTLRTETAALVILSQLLYAAEA